jgi:ribosomal protein L21E
LRPIDYHGQGAVVLAVDTSYIAVGFYIFQEDAENPKLVYYAKFGSRNLNEREARFSQPKRELFGLKEALRLNKMWLFGARKLIVETDAKYIKGMLDHPDMMPNATINRWIAEILMYQFVLRHKAGKTFGPDGLLRRPPQPSDPPLEICSDDERDEEMPGPPEFRVVDPAEPQPLPIEEFVDSIDSRSGYFQGVVKSIHDFQEELAGAVKSVVETKGFILERRIPAETIKQLVSVLSLPPEAADEPTERYYPEEHRSPGAIGQDDLVPHIIEWFRDKSYRPQNFSEKKCKRLLDLTKRFVFYKDRLYRRGKESQHRLYVEKEHRMYMLTAAHDHNGHRGFFATKALLTQRFWWPEMEKDISWYVKTCHVCQERQLQLAKVPSQITHTPSLFEILHVDIMHMTPASNGCKYIVHGRDNLSSWAEAQGLRDEKARSIALWLYEEILCRWGSIREIVTDNAESMRAAMEWAKKKWGIAHITISAYNSKANGKIERPHWDLRQMLYKATGAENVSKWYWFLHAVLWADRVSIRRLTGCSPYFMVTGAHPVLPLDVKEVTWLVKPPIGVLSEEELIGMRARALAKHRIHVEQMRHHISAEKLKRLRRYELDNKAVIKDFHFKPGDQVIVRNTAIESSLDKKMKPRYNGPMIVVAENKGGSYIVAEMTGAVWQHKVAKFRVLPYFARRKIELPEGIMSIIDLSPEGLERLKQLPEEGEDSVQMLSRDYLMDDVNLVDSEERRERRNSA